MSFMKDFREFAFKGNVIDLAVAVIIGAAFGAIVTSLVDDVITPLLLNPALEAAGVANIAELKTANGVLYGKFIAAVIKFLFIAMVLFWLVRVANRINKKPEVAAAPSSTDALLMEIRDLLKK